MVQEASRSEKSISFILILSIIVTSFISFSPSFSTTASAEQPVPPSMRLSLTEGGRSDEEVFLQVAISEGLLSAHSTVSLYEEQENNEILTKPASESIVFEIPIPEKSISYYVKIGDTKSNSVLIESSSDSWNISLRSDAEQFYTDDKTPIISWEINQPLTNSPGLGLYVVDKSNGAIVFRTNTSATTGSFEIPRFYTEAHKEYIAYTGTYGTASKGVRNLSNIQNSTVASDSIKVYRAPWSASIDIDSTQFSTDEPTPKITWNLNQSVGATNNTYALYLTDADTGRILRRDYTSRTQEGEIEVPRLATEGQTNYKVFIAQNNSSIYNAENLQDVQAVSNIVTTKRTPWVVSIAIDKDEFTTGEETPTITWTTNQPIGNTSSYSLYIIDTSNGKIIGRDYSSQTNTGEIPIARFYEGEPRTYKAYIAGYISNPRSIADLRDIQSESNEVTTRRSDWSVEIAVDKTAFSTNDDTPRVMWTTNQPLWTAGYSAFLVDMENGALRKVGVAEDNSSSGEVEIPRFYTGGQREYKVYIALDGRGVKSLSDLREIQAISNSVYVDRVPWTAGLSVDLPDFSTDDPTPVLTWQSNQSVSNTGGSYGIYLIDETNGSVIYKSTGDSSREISIPRFYFGEGREYRAYIAPYGRLTRNKSELRDIQAVSNPVYVKRADWGVSLESEVIDTFVPYLARETHAKVRFNWATNQTISNTDNRYTVFIIDESRKSVIHRITPGYSDNRSGSIEVDIPLSRLGVYRAYVASKGGKSTPAYEHIIDIQAVSGEDFPARSKVVPETATIGGADPSGTECNHQCYGDPVNSATGEFFENSKDLSLNSPIPVSLERSYSSTRRNENGVMGYGWQHNFNMKIVDAEPYSNSSGLLKDSSKINIIQENGAIATFYKTETKYLTHAGTSATLMLDSDSDSLVFERTNGYRFIFDAITGELSRILDRNNNSIELQYENGLLSEVSTSNNQSLIFSYDNANRITRVSSTSEQHVNYEYDSAGNLAFVHPVGSDTPVKYQYTADHKVSTLTNVLNGKTQNVYDSQHRVTKQTDPLGNSISFSYAQSEVGKITTITLPDATKNEEHYNKNNQLVLRKEAVGTDQEAVTSYEYGPLGKQTRVTSPMGNSTHYSYDNAGNMLRFVDSLNNETKFEYNEFNLVTSITDALGHTTSFDYDDKGNLIGSTAPSGIKTKTTYASNGTKSSEFSPGNLVASNGKALNYQYDTNGFVSSVVDEEGNSVSYVNSPSGLVQSSEDALGRVVNFEYDPAGRVLKAIAPNGASDNTLYNNAGLVTSQTDALGRQTTYEYNTMGKTTKINSPLGTSSFVYDARGQLVEEIDYAGRVTKYDYDERGNITSITDPNQNLSTVTWNLDDMVSTITDSEGNTTEFFYDANGNPTKIVDADGNESSSEYNELNLLVSSTDVNGVQTIYSYNVDGQQTRITYADGTYSVQKYDDAGRLSQSLDALGFITSYRYNSLGQVSATIDKSGKQTRYEYDAMGNLLKIIRPDQTSISYEYDSLDLISKVSYDEWATVAIEYERDIAGRIVAVKKEGVRTSYAYDSIGNLTYRGPPSISDGVQYRYNERNEPSSIIYPSGTKVDYKYDNNGNILETIVDGRTIAQNSFTGLNAFSSVQYGNGVVENIDYTALGQISEITATLNEEELYSKKINHGSSGLVLSASTSHGENNSTKSYTYDVLERLDKVETQDNKEQVLGVDGYQFDPVNNLISAKDATNEYNIIGQIVSQSSLEGQTSFEYDGRGNRILHSYLPNSKTDDAERQETSLSWNSDNTLSSVQLSDSSVEYEYGPEGLLSQRTTTQTDSQGSIESFVWNTLSSIPTMISDGNYDYVYNGGSVPIAQINKNTGDLTYLHSDEQGSVVLLTDEVGRKVSSRSYDAYGNIEHASEDSDSVSTSFGYAGEYTDSVTGFQFLRARWYDSSTGSFLSLDPAVLITGEPYGYASANPISNTDPLGLFSLTQLGKSVNWKSVGKIATTVAVTAATAVAVGACVAATAGVCAGAAAPMIIGGVNLAGGIVDYALTEECKSPSGWGIAALASIIPGGSIGKKAVTSSTPSNFLAGTYRDLDKLYPGRSKTAPPVEINHIPSELSNRLYNRFDNPKLDGPAIAMTREDHRQTRTWGSRNKRVANEEYSHGLTTEEIVRRDVRDILQNTEGGRSGRYDSAVRDLLNTHYPNILPMEFGL